MDELRREALDVVASLDEEQMILILAYARCLRDGAAALTIDGLEDVLQEEPI
jgi:hypothetical protein